MVVVKVGSLIIPVIIDSGCTQTIIKEGVVDPHVGEEDVEISMVCIHGRSLTYPRWRISLTVMGKMKKTSCGICSHAALPNATWKGLALFL